MSLSVNSVQITFPQRTLRVHNLVRTEVTYFKWTNWKNTCSNFCCLVFLTSLYNNYHYKLSNYKRQMTSIQSKWDVFWGNFMCFIHFPSLVYANAVALKYIFIYIFLKHILNNLCIVSVKEHFILIYERALTPFLRLPLL